MSGILSWSCPTLRCPVSAVAAIMTPVAAAVSLLLLSCADVDQPRSMSVGHSPKSPLLCFSVTIIFYDEDDFYSFQSQ